MQDALATALFERSLCASLDEAHVIAELALADLNAATTEMANVLNDYVDSSPDELKSVAAQVLGGNNDEEGDSESDAGSESEAALDNDEDDDGDGDGDGEWLEDGECELCDRYIRLTRHHLIPKSTWPKLYPRVQGAVGASEERAKMILGEELYDTLRPLLLRRDSVTQLQIKRALAVTCDICRPCHTAIHKTHDNMELATQYHSIDLLLGDPQIAKFCKWASKQRSGKYAR